jgi:aldehyde dehydrogenase (NAD+)
MNTSIEKIRQIAQAQKTYFRSGVTLDIDFRKKMLRKYGEALKKWEKPLCEALWKDLHKSYEEAFLTEISIVAGEIRNHIANVSKWAAKEKKCSPLKLFPSRSYVVKEPLGNTLIISPWNYPVQLLLNPLVGAISAGCTAILKPSPYVPTVSSVIAEMIAETFDEEYIAVVQGNREVNAALFDLRFDLIFFTGSPSLGKKVMQAAAKNLTPVILELGGKSPCIVDKDADIKLATKRIAWGKTLNSGQTCIAPDYLILHKDIRRAFIAEFAKQVEALHGKDIQTSEHYVRMVNDAAFDRVVSYLKDGDVIYGGRHSKSERFIEPTLLENMSLDSPVMQEEIFGPVFPMVVFDGDPNSFKDKVINFVTSREKPLAFYYFGKENKGWDIIKRTSSGGACINDTIMHIANENIPFGGVGNSGLGSYHSKESFDAFSHKRAVVATGTWIDLPFRYMPYKLLPLVKKIL